MMYTTTTPILSTHELSVGYKKGKNVSVVMQGLDLRLRQGCVTALLGSNGIGKSTLLRTIAGAQPALSGSVLLDGRLLQEYDKKELSRRLSLVYTDRTQAGGLTVCQLVSLGRYPHTGFFGRLDSKDYEVVAQAMRATGIWHKGNSFVAELSDGERQKAMVARALAQETPVILLDEPTAFLDVASRIDVMFLLHTLAREQGKAVLLSTHDISQALLLADELWVVTHEHTILQGCTEDLILSGAMQQMFFAAERGGVASFDASVGDFEAALPVSINYNLECDDMVLKHWITNALRRNGISVDEEGDMAGRIIASASDDITLLQGGGRESIHCLSVEELLCRVAKQ